MRARASGERGSATVLGVVFLGVLVSVAAMATVLGGVLVDRRRVEAAVDLGALAGAAAAQRGEAGCEVAADVVRRNGAHQEDCRSDGLVVRVRASRRTGSLLGRRFTVVSSASAGPGFALGPDGPADLGDGVGDSRASGGASAGARAVARGVTGGATRAVP